MRVDLVLTVLGPDRPGLVELISKTVTGHQGNWEASRMAHMAGRFAGILRVTVPEEEAENLARALAGLEGQGLRVVIERAGGGGGGGPAEAGGTAVLYKIDLVGNDRPGVIRDVSSQLAERGINVEELATECVSAPMAGGLLLKVSAQVRAIAAIDADELRRMLETRAPDFLVDVARLGEPGGKK